MLFFQIFYVKSDLMVGEHGGLLGPDCIGNTVTPGVDLIRKEVWLHLVLILVPNSKEGLCLSVVGGCLCHAQKHHPK